MRVDNGGLKAISVLSIALGLACGGNADDGQKIDIGPVQGLTAGVGDQLNAGTAPQTMAGTTAAAGTGAGPAAGTAAAPMAGVGVAAGIGAAAGVMAPLAGMNAPAAGVGSLPMAGAAGASTALPPVGPEDGDPSTPVVEAPGVPCGPNPSLFGLTSSNVTIGGREVHLAYPCAKHGGAPVTFVLNLHGTMPDEGLKGYQVAYFSINNHVDTHNLITAAPKSVVAQWGNQDMGADLPHIMEVIDYVYTTFADFDIRGMWIAGHSWGSGYTARLVCDSNLADKVVGTVMQSGPAVPPACADRISVISSAAEMDIGPVVNQGGIPASRSADNDCLLSAR